MVKSSCWSPRYDILAVFKSQVVEILINFIAVYNSLYTSSPTLCVSILSHTFVFMYCSPPPPALCASVLPPRLSVSPYTLSLLRISLYFFPLICVSWFQALLQCLETLGGRGFTNFTHSLLQLECVNSVRNVLNIPSGFRHVIDNQECVASLTKGTRT